MARRSLESQGCNQRREKKKIISFKSWKDGTTIKIQKKSQVARLTEAYCKYLDYLYTIDMPYTAPHHQRSPRYENTTTMKSGDPDLQAGSNGKARGLQENNKDVVQSLKRTRKRKFIHPRG